MSHLSPLFEAKGLQCERDYRRLFNNVVFSLNSGDVIQIGGHNGVGKTTLLRGICGLNADVKGEFNWFGETWPECRYNFALNTLFLGHAAGIKPILSPRENLRWYFDLRESVNNTQLDAALDKVGLYGYEETPCFKLSAGQQRRVALARLYLSQAKVWVLDEPFTAIDLNGVNQLEQMINEFAHNGGAVMLTSHHVLQGIENLQIVNLEQYSE